MESISDDDMDSSEINTSFLYKSLQNRQQKNKLNHNRNSFKSSNNKSKYKSNLSFETDEVDENIIEIKKSKYSHALQQPNDRQHIQSKLLTRNNKYDTEISSFHETSEYSKDSIENLKKEQQFLPKEFQNTNSVEEFNYLKSIDNPIELSGENAELLIEELEAKLSGKRVQFADNDNNDNNDNEFIAKHSQIEEISGNIYFNDDMKAIKESKNKFISKNTMKQSKLSRSIDTDENDDAMFYTATFDESMKTNKQTMIKSSSYQSDRNEYMNNISDEGNDWEEQILKRIGKTTNSSSKLSGNSLLTTTSLTKTKNSIEDALRLLTESNENINRSINQLNIQSNQSIDQVAMIKSKISDNQQMIDFIDELISFSSNVTMMLRAKERSLMNWNQSSFDLWKGLTMKRNYCLQKIQEDILIRLLNSHDLYSFDSYYKVSNETKDRLTKMLSTSNNTNDEILVLSNQLVDITQELKAIEKHIQSVSIMFDDVKTDLSSISHLLNRFDKLRNTLGVHYRNAFISLSLPSLLEPFVLLELNSNEMLISLANEVVDQDTDVVIRFIQSIQIMDWYQQIDKYAKDTPSELETLYHETNINESDSKLLNRVISRTLIPWFANLVEMKYFYWMSTTHCKVCVAFLKDLLIQSLGINRVFHNTMKMIALQIETCIIDSICLPICCNPMNNIQSLELIKLQFSKLMLLIRNLSYFYDILSKEVMILLGWQVPLIKLFDCIRLYKRMKGDMNIIVCDLIIQCLQEIFTLVSLDLFEGNQYKYYDINVLRNSVQNFSKFDDSNIKKSRFDVKVSTNDSKELRNQIINYLFQFSD